MDGSFLLDDNIPDLLATIPTDDTGKRLMMVSVLLQKAIFLVRPKTFPSAYEDLENGESWRVHGTGDGKMITEL